MKNQDTVNYNKVFSAQLFEFIYNERQSFWYWAIAVHGEIVWDVWDNGSQAPFFWGKTGEMEEMIQRRDPELLKLLTPEGLAELHKERYDRIMAEGRRLSK